MEALLRPVTNRICSMPFCTSSSTTYCTMGLRATGSISLGCDLVAGSRRVPTPATGTIALLITSRLYWIEGKEKANGRSGTAGRAAAQDRPHRSQVRRRSCEAGCRAAPAAASGALLRRGADLGRGGRNRVRRALRDREAVRATSPPRQYG